jgi:hypothetical protein
VANKQAAKKKSSYHCLLPLLLRVIKRRPSFSDCQESMSFSALLINKGWSELPSVDAMILGLDQ